MYTISLFLDRELSQAKSHHSQHLESVTNSTTGGKTINVTEATILNPQENLISKSYQFGSRIPVRRTPLGAI
jgi:hypothetical protein